MTALALQDVEVAVRSRLASSDRAEHKRKARRFLPVRDGGSEALDQLFLSSAPLQTRPRDTHRVMAEESTTPDLVELVRRQLEAVNRRDLDAVMSLCPPDGVYDTRGAFGVYEGTVAIRGFLEEWWGTFAELRFELEELLDLGNGVTFSVVREDARPVGSTGYVRRREAYVIEWVEGMVARLTVYDDIEEGRAAAERLAKEGG